MMKDNLNTKAGVGSLLWSRPKFLKKKCSRTAFYKKKSSRAAVFVNLMQYSIRKYNFNPKM